MISARGREWRPRRSVSVSFDRMTGDEDAPPDIATWLPAQPCVPAPIATVDGDE
jgi:hypothetical protein